MRTSLRKPLLFATALLFANLLFSNNICGQTQTFTTNGNFIVPAGVTSVTVECWGGGGAGGAASGSFGTTFGGGGAGGSYTKTIVSVSPGASIPVVVGIGGVGGSGDGGNGGTSTFGSPVLASATGGNGGKSSSNGGGGGTPTSGTFSGGSGSAGSGSGSGAGGGGAGSGPLGTGGDASGTTGGTGGNGGGGNGAAGRTTSGNGNSATTLGGGGGGAFVSLDFSHTGGNGFRGQVIISWTVCPTITASAAKLDLKCFQVNEGAITVTGSGGTAPYMFSIDNITNYNATVIAGASYMPIDGSNGKFINLPIGTYKIRVKDANGCESKVVQ